MASFPYSGLPMDIAKMVLPYLIHNENVQSMEIYNYNNLYVGPANDDNAENPPEQIFELNNKHWVITGQTSALLLACKSVRNEVMGYRLQHTDTLDFLTCCQIPSGKVAGQWNTFNRRSTKDEPQRAYHSVSGYIANNYPSTGSDHQNHEPIAYATRILNWCFKASMFKSPSQTQMPVIWAAEMFKKFLKSPKPVGWFKQLKQVNLRYPGHMVALMGSYELQRPDNQILSIVEQFSAKRRERLQRRAQRNCGVEHLRDAMRQHSFADELSDICNLLGHPVLIRECPYLRINLDIDMRRPFGGNWGPQLIVFVGSIYDSIGAVLRSYRKVWPWPNPPPEKTTLLAGLTITFTGPLGSLTVHPLGFSGADWLQGMTMDNITF